MTSRLAQATPGPVHVYLRTALRRRVGLWE